jgi:flavodoxin
MNTLVIYDSQYGNTERIAQAIADAARAYGPAQAMHVDPAHPIALEGVDMLVVGCPTQAWNATRTMRDVLQTLAPEQLSDVRIACFDTRFHKPRWLTGSAARVMAKKFREMGGALIAPPESFFVENSEGPLERGALERAATWARALAKAVEESQPVAP